jgi:hypothetical protein
MVVGLSWLGCVQPVVQLFFEIRFIGYAFNLQDRRPERKGIYLLHGAHRIRVNGLDVELVRRGDVRVTQEAFRCKS